MTGPVVNDTTQFQALVESVGTPIREIYADAGYFSNKNAFVARSAGATPFIRSKKTTKQRAPPPKDRPDLRTPFERMVSAEQHDPAWKGRYGRRNRVESTFGAIKRRFGGRLRATNRFMRLVEGGLKLLVWNLTRVRRRT